MSDPSTQASTLRGRPHIRVGEYGDGTPWVMIEVEKSDFPIFQGGFAGFDLKAGTTYDEAKKIVEFLRAHIDTFTVTLFHATPGPRRVQ